MVQIYEHLNIDRTPEHIAPFCEFIMPQHAIGRFIFVFVPRDIGASATKNSVEQPYHAALFKQPQSGRLEEVFGHEYVTGDGHVPEN